MEQEIKQQIFDILNKGEVIGVDKPFQEIRSYGVPIPDDIEARMLDWMEENQSTLFKEENSVKINYKLEICYMARSVSLTVDSKFCTDVTGFEWEDTESRPVAIAEACVWVYQQLPVKSSD